MRINPGNIGGPDKVAEVVAARKQAGIPMRIGANSGSLPKHLEALAQEDQAEALVEAALEEVRLLEPLDYYDFKISVKSSHVPTMIRAYRMLAGRVPYPLHLGVTEAGPPLTGAIKSAVGLGALLADGIGDTIRVSLTADPVEEVKVAWEILKSLGLRERGRPYRGDSKTSAKLKSPFLPTTQRAAYRAPSAKPWRPRAVCRSTIVSASESKPSSWVPGM